MAGDEAAPSSTQRLIAWLPVVLGQQLAACLLYAAESVELWRIDAGGFAAAARQALVVMASGGTALGVIVAGFEALRRAVELRAGAGRARLLASAGVFYAALALAPLYWLGSELFSGAWISRQAYAPLGPPLVALFGSIGVFVLLRAVALLSSIAVSLAVAALVVVGAACAFLDRSIAKDLYLYLHGALMLLCALSLGGASRLIIERIVRPSPRRALLVAIPVGALSLATVLVFTHGPNFNHRLFWDRHPSYSGRLYEGVRKAAFTLRMRATAGGTYRDDVAVWTSDQKALPSPDQSLAAWQGRIGEAQSAASRVPRLFADGVKPHLIMITVDALRADIAYEAKGPGTLSGLGESGLVFQRAYAGSASTRMSLPVLLSGRTDWRLHEQNIFPALAQGSYQTVFVTDGRALTWLKYQDQLWLDQPGSTLTANGDAQGWSSEQITQLAVQRIAEQRAHAPLFMWVHYFDVHEWKKLEQDVRGGDPASSYRRAWTRVQAQIAKVVQAAQAKLGADRVAIVIGSDHGEYLGEMSRTHHGKWVAPELVRVPLVLIAPGLQPRQVLDPVGLIDVAPTLALLGGVSVSGAEGIPLLAPSTAELARRPLVMGEDIELGVVLGDHRLVLEPGRNLIRMYDDAGGGQELAGRGHAALQSELLGLLLGSPVARQ